MKVGDKLYTYYLEDNIRARRLTVAGIYQTNFSAYDDLFLITDLYTVVRLNNWKKDQVGGVEIEVGDYALLEQINEEIRGLLNEKQIVMEVCITRGRWKKYILRYLPGSIYST